MAITFPIRTPEQAFSLVGTLGKFRIPGLVQGTAIVEGTSPGDVTWPEAVLADSLNSLQQNALDKTAAALTSLHEATFS
jgi:hypothetical protein